MGQVKSPTDTGLTSTSAPQASAAEFRGADAAPSGETEGQGLSPEGLSTSSEGGAPPTPSTGTPPVETLKQPPVVIAGNTFDQVFIPGDPSVDSPSPTHPLLAPPPAGHLAAGTLLAPGDILAKTDGRTFALSAQKDGKIRVLCGLWEDAKVIEPHQELVFVWRDGQVVAIRRDKRC